MSDFEQPKKYTMGDLQMAIGEDDAGTQSAGMNNGLWGSTATAIKTGNTTDMQEKLAKMQEMKKQQAA